MLPMFVKVKFSLADYGGEGHARPKSAASEAGSDRWEP